ncbi:O-methyltransferase, partial [Escherichia coli]
MSTGGSIPYHLRQNKAIERNLFIESLRRLNNYTNIS